MEGKIKSGDALDRCVCNHAEANAIMHCAILGIEAGTQGAILYSTFVPCLECTKMAITIGKIKLSNGQRCYYLQMTENAIRTCYHSI